MDQSNLHLDPRRCALLIIDMQNDFVSPGGYHHRKGKSCGPMQAVIPNIQFLLRELPQEIRRVYIVTAREPDGSDSHWRFHRILPERMRLTGQNQGNDRNALRGTWGAAIIDHLKPKPEDPVFSKRRYSAFYQTDLEMCLRCWDIHTLIFTGVAAEICVETTVRDAFVRDFDIIVVSDGVASWDEEACHAMLRLIKQDFGLVLPSANICQKLF
ncbi:MAG: isochorismatase family cysteine hydrolase [Deltaproteobacteria bacterium]